MLNFLLLLFLFSSGLVAFHCVLDGLNHVAIRIDVFCESLQTVLSLLGFEFRSWGVFFFPQVFWKGLEAGSGAGGGGRRGCVFATLFVGVVVMGITNVQHVSKAAAEGLTAKFSDLCDPQELLKQQSQQQQRRTRMSQLASKSRQATKTFRQIRLREKTLDDVLTYYLSSPIPEEHFCSLIPLSNLSLFVPRTVDLRW